MKIHLLKAVLGALLLSGCGSLRYAPVLDMADSASPVLIRNVSIFDGTSKDLQSGRDVLLAEGKIQRIGEGLGTDDLGKYSDARVVDGSGKTLMPGLIDAHVHLTGSGSVPWANKKANVEHNLQAYLYTGITTVYDLGGIGKKLEKLATKVESGKLPGPTVYHAHIPITVRNSHPIPLTQELMPWPLSGMVNGLVPTVDDPSKADALVRKYAQQNIDYVKAIVDEIPPGSPFMSTDQLKAIADAAHAKGYKVFVHIGSPQNTLDAIEAGADILAHGVWRGELSTDQAAQLAATNIPVISTIAGFVNVDAINRGQFEPRAADEKLVSGEVLDPVTGPNGRDVQKEEAMGAFFGDVTARHPHLRPNFERMIEAGVVLIVGTDSNLPGTYAGATYLQELQLLSEAGMSNFDILAGATSRAAGLFLDQPGFGTVAEGQTADLLLLDGNPLTDLAVLKAPAMILKAGREVKRR